MKGHITRVPSGKNYAFIQGEDGLDYFFHAADLKDFDNLFNAFMRAKASKELLTCEFKPKSSEKGKRALNVILDEPLV